MLIAERYQLGEKLGAGGMGTVYRAHDQQTGQTVAIKALHSRNLPDADMLERFRREGEALSQLNHPNIVRMLATHEQDGQHYLILEYVAGGDLSQWLKRESLPIARVVEIALDIADALTRAHKLRIIHRDLKPANVLIAEDASPRLTDFGVAYLENLERVTQQEAIIGTMDYLAPELLMGNLPNEKTDLWAFGVLLFEMLTGQRPFLAGTAAQVITGILSKPIPDIEALRPELPSELVDLVYRLLEKDPAMRISSARIVGAALESILQTQTPIPQAMLNAYRFMDETPTPALITPHNLPTQPMAFVGREVELAELDNLLRDSSMHLISILAHGGMGKTRLALEAARRNLALFPQGVYFVALAPLENPSEILDTLASALNFQFQKDERRPRQQLLDYLRDKMMLLIFDNFEHLITGADLVSEILNSAPQVKIIVTSRLRLNQSGEVVLRLEPLDVAAWESLTSALEASAVQLFLQGAKRARLDYELSLDELPHVAHICKAVDGLPLGIILASSWVAMLRTDEICAEIERSFDILETDLRDVPERQRSIRAVYDYSWRLMSTEEQEAFAKLAVFRDGFSREAAQAVTGASLRMLMRLMQQSLINRHADSGRYHMHQVLQQYAESSLGEGASAAKAAHARYFADYAQSLLPQLLGKGQVAAMNAIETDSENIHVAWRWAVQQKDEAVIDKLMDVIYWYCQTRGQVQHGEMLFVLARDVWNKVKESRVAARLAVRFPLSGTPFTWLYRQAIEAARAANDQFELAFCLLQSGRSLSHYQGKEYGIEQLQESLDLYRQQGSRFYEALVLDALAWGESLQGRGDIGLTYAKTSLQIRRDIGDLLGMADSMRNLALAFWAKGKVESALDLLQQSRENAQALGDRGSVAASSLILAYSYLLLGKFEDASPLIHEAVLLASDLGSSYLLNLGQAVKAFEECLHGQAESAKTRLRDMLAERRIRALDHSLVPVVGMTYSIVLLTVGDYAKALLCMKDSLPTFQRDMESLGHYMATQWFVHHALLLYQQEDYQQATEILGLVFEGSQVDTLWARRWQTTIQLKHRLFAHLGESEYQAAYERGKGLNVKQTVEAIFQRYR